MTVSIAHDYLTQRGGAERVVLSMLRTFRGAAVYTSLYDPDATYPEFRAVDVRVSGLNRVAVFRQHHRLALPLLAPAFSWMRSESDVLICSSTGWAHGVQTAGRKIVYCHGLARWLYQAERYFSRRSAGGVSMMFMRRRLLNWDRRAAAQADRYLVASRAVRDGVRQAYGIEAEILPPPHGVDSGGSQQPIDGVEPGFLLCVSRLLPYKNVGVVAEAMRSRPTQRLVVVGDGPEGHQLRSSAPQNVLYVGSVDDAELRWLYAHSAAAVSAAYEDFGLVPLEAAAFGKPTAALRFGGFLDTIEEGRTGVHFEQPTVQAISAAVDELLACEWSDCELRSHAARFNDEAFGSRLKEIVGELGSTPALFADRPSRSASDSHRSDVR